MPGMIWNAHNVLQQALDASSNGIPKDLFKGLKGIVLISSVEAGFIFTGCIGTGILLEKKGLDTENKWSLPCAVGLAGSTFGAVAGISYRDLMVFIYSEDSLKTMAGDAGLKIGAQLELTIGEFGRNGHIDINASNKGLGSTIAVAFSKGIFGCAGIDFGAVSVRNGVNTEFYGKELNVRQILDGEVDIPEGPKTLIGEVYEKLGLLAEGKTHTVTEEERAKVESARQAIHGSAKK